MTHHKPNPYADCRLSRRQLLTLSAGIALTSLCRPLLGEPLPESLVFRAIPSSGERIPVIGLGTARTFNVSPDNATAMAARRKVLDQFYQGGGRLVDSSPMYGTAETVVGELAAELGIADELFMATKIWTQGREDGIAQMTRSQRRMGGGPLDLVQVHNLVDTDTHLDTLKAWRKEGRIRYIGVTHYQTGAFDRLATLCEREPLDFVQFNYNILEREAEKRLLPVARDNGVATLINEPFEKGTLFGRVRGKDLPAWAADLDITSWAQFFLKFIASHPAVTCAIPATSDPGHARDNIQAAHGAMPDTQQRERMAALVRQL
ncbi:aldo/keto reductase [Marinobacter caseinilyticus]|uniref:aldo/keto reductase n=1 Tax=Marinobacter caseinilyticus TaxID=2692195 RepID=UPI001A93F2AE|nr:aldo/keto reductase [Marinobacter caseinilyticus]